MSFNGRPQSLSPTGVDPGPLMLQPFKAAQEEKEIIATRPLPDDENGH